VFQFNGRQLRINGTPAEPWFCGKDVAQILGYEKPSKAIQNHVDLEDKMSLDQLFDKLFHNENKVKPTNKNDLRTIYINESGLYSLILRSKLDAAKAFKRWITSEVLPSIRKNNYYVDVNINSEKIKQLEHELAQEKHKLAQEKCRNVILTNFTNNVKQRLKKEIIYLATTKRYAVQNFIKVGGCASREALRKRLTAYNTGRPDDDKYYFCYVEETPNYAQLEKRIKDLLSDFMDNNNKEMYVIHFNSLRSFVDLLKNNYGNEIKELNTFLKNFAKDLVDNPPVIPEPIILDRIDITHIRNGEPVEEKSINLDDFDEEKQTEIVKGLLAQFKETLDAGTQRTNRKDFENFIKEKKYVFKSRPLWNTLKKALTKSFNLTIAY
jgi:prophage antirepressor-like protein